MKMPLKIANVCVDLYPFFPSHPSLTNAITDELCQNASIYCKMAVIDFRLCVRVLFDIFVRVLAKCDSFYSFNSPLAPVRPLLFMYLTCSNCHQNMHTLRERERERWRIANCRKLRFNICSR